MENRFEQNQPEEQGWGAYVRPPGLNNQPHQEAQRPTRAGLCVKVREMLPALVENDGDIRPEMASAVFGHLSTCPGCSREFDEMQRVVTMLQEITQPEMPMDFSGIIMQRIISDAVPIRSGVQGFPTAAAASFAPLEAAASQTGSRRDSFAAVQGQAQASRTAVENHSNLGLWERLTLGGVLSAMLAVFLSSAWGRNMVGVNLEATTAWLQQMQMAVANVPVLNTLVGFVISALSQVSGLLEETYHTLGARAVIGLALDVSLCALLYYLFVARNGKRSRNGQ